MIEGESKGQSFGVRSIIKIRSVVNDCVQNVLRMRRVKRVDDLYLSLIQQITQTQHYPTTPSSRFVNVNELLTKEQHQEVDDLFSRYIKTRHNSHLFYTAKTGIFQKEYIPDSIWKNYIDPYYNNWNLANAIDNKCYYPRMFAGVRLPKMIAYRLNGFWYNNDGLIIDLDKALSMIMDSSECFIKKAVNSWGGMGVYFFKPSEQSIDDLKTIIKRIPVDLVIQEGIKQSPVLSSCNKDSVNTVRILSQLKKDGSVKIYSCVLRMGIKGSKVDNASSGGISVGIKEDGKLKSVAYSNTGIKYTEHPSTHVKFGDFYIPNFQKMKDIVFELQPLFPHFRLIGRDMACDKNNEPILIEANLCDSELDFHQLNNGPVFGNDTEEILSEVFEKN